MRVGVLLLGVPLALGVPGSDGQPNFSSGFRAPRVPPRVHYAIDCAIDVSNGRLVGTETVRFTNETSEPVRRLALDWAVGADRTLEITVNGSGVQILAPEGATEISPPVLFDLPTALPAGRLIEMRLAFSKRLPRTGDQERLTLSDWHPRLWWGLPTHDDYDVQVRAPAEYALATSGRLDRVTGHYRAEGVRSFGLFLGKEHRVREADAGGVLVRALHTAKADECARLLIETAVDVIGFYRERFGFYPHSSLTIVPGADLPLGGYPLATGLVVVHGQERFSERPESHWRWITAHEIGHQYWLEHVLTRDATGTGWLMIGLGLYADREYSRARGLGPDKHQSLMQRYVEGVREHLDTTAERPVGQQRS